MSPRAACWLEHHGLTKVFDYVGGIADWKAAGLHVEGCCSGDDVPDMFTFRDQDGNSLYVVEAP